MRETQKRHKAANAKARALQNKVRDDIEGVTGYMWHTQPMGQAGPDVYPDVATPAPPWEYIDAKNHAKFPSIAAIKEHMESSTKNGHWVAVLKQTDRARSVPVVLMDYSQWLILVGHYYIQGMMLHGANTNS